MLIEAPKPASAEQSEQKTQSIFDFYSIEREVDFIYRMEGLPDEKKRFYLTENVNHFLGEFAGKVPYTKISFLLKPEGLEYAGFRLSQTYQRALNGGTQREADEWVGFRQVEKMLMEGGRGATWISPPKGWDYSFVFHFEVDPETNQVDEYVLRYPEEQNTVEESNVVLQTLFPSLRYENSSAFLRNPLSSDHPKYDREKIMNKLGIRYEEMDRSKLFENRVRNSLSDKINEYIDAVLAGDSDTAHAYLIGLYNAAKQIKIEVDKVPMHRLGLKQVAKISPISHEQFMAYTAQKASVIGGGSCPSTRAGNSTPLSGASFLEQLQAGSTLADIFNKDTCPDCSRDSKSHFHCPGCGGSIKSGEGTETCPHCNLNKDDYAERTGVAC